MNRHAEMVQNSAPVRGWIFALSFVFAAVANSAWADNVPVILPAAPALPAYYTGAGSVYNITTSYAAINGGAAATAGSSANQASIIQSYINYVSTLQTSTPQGIQLGGTVEVSAGVFKSGSLTMKSNVNLQLDSSSTLQDYTAGSTLITTSGSGLHDMAITGSGILDGNASAATGSNLVSVQNVNRLLISGVTIENAGHEHLVPEKDTNVTISGININDHNSITSASNSTHTYLGNTDGIDYSGTNVLIQNCNIADGDDDIVAKPASTACNNIVINNCNIYSGHGISIGGGTAAGVSNMIVANCTFNPAGGTDPTKNSVTYGLRMKAEDGNDPNQTQSGDVGGGTAHPLKNVKYINITMMNVQHPIAIESFYDGGDTFADSPTNTAFYTYGPAGTAPTAISTSTPLWDNIAYENVTATGASNVLRINGLNIYDPTHPQNGTVANAIDGLSFSNVHLSGSSSTQLYYGADVDTTGLTLTGTTLSTFGLTNLTSSGVQLLPGDFNRDGSVNAADLPTMMSALSNLSNYKATYGLSDPQIEVIADLNNDFTFNNADAQAFLTLLQTGLGSTSSVPEPETFVLLAAGGLIVLCRRRGRIFVRNRQNGRSA